MLEKLVSKLESIKNDDDEAQSAEFVYKAIADYCLDKGYKAPHFQNNLIKQMLIQIKQANPNYSNMRLAIITGINRRNITKLLNGEDYYQYIPKEDKVMNYISSYCTKNNTSRIKKLGHIDSFQAFCEAAANGSLTYNAIAQELLEQGKIVDNGRFYKIPKNLLK